MRPSQPSKQPAPLHRSAFPICSTTTATTNSSVGPPSSTSDLRPPAPSAITASRPPIPQFPTVRKPATSPATLIEYLVLRPSRQLAVRRVGPHTPALERMTRRRTLHPPQRGQSNLGKHRFPHHRMRSIAGCLCLFFTVTLALAPISRGAKLPPQAAQIQTYPERPTPSQPAVPGPRSQQPNAPESPKTEQYTLSQDRYAKAVAYSRARYILYFVSYVAGVLVLVLLLSLGVVAKFRDFAERVTGNRWLQGLVFVPLLIATLDLCDLPIHLYGHTLSLRYEQSVQGWGSWFWDWSKSELLGVGFAIVLVFLLFAVMRWSPRRWWFFFWLAALPILLFVLFISPWFIDPLFNTFQPLAAKYPTLAAEMEKVVQRASLDIPEDRMFLMEASKKTNDVNAYVTGLGASKRVVVWDTTIQKLRTYETLFVFGHEVGHYVLHHIRNGFLFFAAMLFVVLYIGYRGLHWSL